MDEQSTAKCLKCGLVHPQFTHCSRMDSWHQEPNKQVALEAENAALRALLREAQVVYGRTCAACDMQDLEEDCICLERAQDILDFSHRIAAALADKEGK